jgi:hypothetical protein
MEYFCKSLNWSEKGAFFTLPRDKMDLGSGVCSSGHHPPPSGKYSGLSLMLAVDADLRMIASSLGVDADSWIAGSIFWVEELMPRGVTCLPNRRKISSMKSITILIHYITRPRLPSLVGDIGNRMVA